MPVPNLIHPQDVTIRPVDKGATVFDRDAREPIREVSRATNVAIPAQISWTPEKRPEFTRIGANEQVVGYLLFRRTDLAALAYTPKRGDLIVDLQGDGTKLWLTQMFPAGHYPRLGATLTRAFFSARRPGSPVPDQG